MRRTPLVVLGVGTVAAIIGAGAVALLGGHSSPPSASASSTTTTSIVGSTSTTQPSSAGSTTLPSSTPNVPGTVPVANDSAALPVVTAFVEHYWATNPAWPIPGYGTYSIKPYVTPSIYTQLLQPALAPLTPTELVSWQQDKKLGVGEAVGIPQTWIVTQAGVFPTTCVVETLFYTYQTQHGQPVAGRTNNDLKYSFQMTKIKGRWYIASLPSLPQ